MTTLADLNTSGLISLNAEGNRDVSLSVGVFMGNASFVVFTKGGPPSFKVTLNTIAITLLKKLLRKMVSGAKPGYRQALNLRDFDQENRKFNVTGGLAFGIDDNNTLYIEAAGKGLTERHKFPVKIPGSWDVSNTDLTEREIIEVCAESIIDALTYDVSAAKALTRVKRKQGQGGGGKSGGGNWGNKGGNSGGGGNTRVEEEDYFS